jgi:hypothetical protein
MRTDCKNLPGEIEWCPACKRWYDSNRLRDCPHDSIDSIDLDEFLEDAGHAPGTGSILLGLVVAIIVGAASIAGGFFSAACIWRR